MINNILEEKPKTLLDKFLIDYNTIENIDIIKARELIKRTMRYYNGDSNERNKLVHLQDMENRWYKLEDYSIYNDTYYFTDLWSCWIIYSRKYLKSIIKKGTLTNYITNISIKDLLSLNIQSILDLGCGLGYTSATLKQLFKEVKVYATNLDNTKQYRFCKLMSEKYNFTLTSSIYNISSNIDLVFASEYFEHIKNPLEHLQEIITLLHPKAFIIANSFNTRSIGHFKEYKHFGEIICEKKISRYFNNYLKLQNYIKIKTKIWNNKPSLFIRAST